MEPLVYIIAIMGCADDGSMCARQRIEPVTYHSQAQCQAALPKVLRHNTDLDYPTISGKCEANSVRAARAKIAAQQAG